MKGFKKKYTAFIAIIPLLIYFWPSFLGGSTDFITVYGESMLPTMETGSLAILRNHVQYGVGDIIAYNYLEMGVSKVIIHRIIAINADGNFILKGDNNRSNDPEPVKNEQIIGKLFLHIPYFGYLPLMMKHPVVLAITMMALAFIAMLDKKKKNTQITQQIPQVHSEVPMEVKVKKKPKVKKGLPQISLFIPALIINMAYYVMSQYAISLEVSPRDGYTTLLQSFVDPYLASTLGFGSWFAAIVGTFIMSKYSVSIEYRKHDNARTGTMQVSYQRQIPFKTISQFFWMIFTGYYGLYLFVLVTNLRT